MCGPGCCRREVWRSPEKVVQEWSSWMSGRITHRCRHSKSQRRHKSVPVSSGLNASNSCSTGNPWSKRVDSKLHKLDGFPHGVVILLLWREWAESTSVLLKRSWRRDSLAGFHYFYVAQENFPGWIVWVILIGWKYATTIRGKLIYAPNKNTKFFLLHIYWLGFKKFTRSRSNSSKWEIPKIKLSRQSKSKDTWINNCLRRVRLE